MTATSAGSSGCLAAKGLDISLAALQRQDPYINNIMDVASQVALYTYNNRANEWEKTQVEGTLFIYTRLASPKHGFTIMNRLSMENLTEPITKDLDLQLQDPFLLYRNARLVIHGIWFYDKEDFHRIAQRMKILTQQEQVLAQGGWLSPGGGGGGNVEAKGVDIIQMLTKAHTEYDKEKSTTEPKEIGGSSVLYGNPNLIKPIPVKPHTQDSDGAEPRPLSLATLFGSQHHVSPKPDAVSPMSASATGSSAVKAARPPVARTLSYDSAVGSKVGGDAGVQAVMDGQTVRRGGATVVAGVLQSPTSACRQQQQQQQHCPAIQKLMQGQRGAGGVGGVLQTLSESPENRLCDNGVPLDHHHHHHHHHLYHLQQQQQQQSDPIKRLFQSQLPPPSSGSGPPPPPPPPPCCSIGPPLQQNPLLPAQHVMVESCSHLHAQQNQQLFLSLSQPQPDMQHKNQSASAAQGTGLLPSQVCNDQCPKPEQAGGSSQMPGVVSPHELLQKLQLVQQEQSLASHDPPRLCPALAPRFLGPAHSQGGGLKLGPASNQTSALPFQVISPQRIPATVAPSLLLSPSMFTQVKSSGAAVPSGNCTAPSTSSSLEQETRVLSRKQLQASLLHLIQTDSSFLDKIYDAYVGQFANSSSSKY